MERFSLSISFIRNGDVSIEMRKEFRSRIDEMNMFVWEMTVSTEHLEMNRLAAFEVCRYADDKTSFSGLLS